MTEIKRIPGGLTGKCSAVCYGGLVYAVANAAAPGGDITAQTTSCLTQLDHVLASAGSDKTKLLQVTIYLSDIRDKPAMDRIWLPWIGPENNWPQRACVGVELDPGWIIEIVAIATT